MKPSPVFKKKRGISPVWTLPILALAICLWIVYTSFQNAGTTITIFFEDASGITPGKTQVIVRGIPVGTVEQIEPDLRNRRIKTTVIMDRSVEDMLVADTLFWIVRPEISAASVQGLDTLLSGSYIGMQPGSSETEKRNFTGLSSPPPISKETPGLHIQLRAEELGSIQNGSKIYYRNLEIGTVTNHILSDDDNNILIDVFIEPEYAHLVREGSRFYNASGINISGKLTNLEVHVESLASLLKGGIVLHTPDELAHTVPAENGDVFPLYKDLESARYGISMTLQLASSMGITEGETKLIYRGLVAGVVEKIEFNDDERHTVTAHIMLDPRAERILRQGTRFWIVRPEISITEIKNLDILLSGPYITFIPGDGPYQNHFEILPEPPPQKPLRPGSELLLTAEESYSIHKGAPVRYKKKKVGEVLDVELDSTLSRFDILIFIYRQYEELIQPTSVFWNDGGFLFDASLSGIRLQSDSISSVLSGGISFSNPSQADGGVPTEKRALVEFPVYASFAEAMKHSPHLQSAGYHFQLRSPTPPSFSPGTPISFKNIQVGEVRGFQLADNNQSVLIDCLIEQRYRDTVNSSSRFYTNSGITVEGDLSGLSLQTGSLQSLVSGGISYYTPKPEAGQAGKAVFALHASRKDAEAVDKIGVLVRFQDVGNLHKGSPVKYKGIEIGEVVELHFAENMNDIMVSLLVDQQAEPLFRTNTRIWLEKTEIGLTGVKNLKSLLFGSYINVLPGSGDLQRQFAARIEPPTMPADTADGLNIILTSTHLGSLKINSPVSYRQIVIGKVVNFDLSEDFTTVLILINIRKKYAPLIRENTKFWTASGARIEGGLFSGISVSTESLSALLNGGIALATPNVSEMGAPVDNYHRFPLHEEAKEQWLDWQPAITLVEGEDSPEDK